MSEKQAYQTVVRGKLNLKAKGKPAGPPAMVKTITKDKYGRLCGWLSKARLCTKLNLVLPVMCCNHCGYNIAEASH